MRRRQLIPFTLALTQRSAHAEAGVIKAVFIEDLQGITPLDDPAFTDCLGYQGQMYEDRDGVYNSPSTPRGPWPSPMSRATSPAVSSSVPFRAPGRLQRHLPRAGHRQLPHRRRSRHSHPAASFYLYGNNTGSDGSQIRFTIRGHFVLDKRTGEVRRNTIISTCHVS